MAIAVGWTLTGSHVGGHFGNTCKKLSVVTLWPCNTTLATGPSSQTATWMRTLQISVSADIRLSIVCDGEASTATSRSAHPMERPAALSQKESSVRADRVKATTDKLSICAKEAHTHVCIDACALARLRRVWKGASSCASQFPPGKGRWLLVHTVLGFTSEDIWLVFSLKPSLEHKGLRSSVSGKSSIPRGRTAAEQKWWRTSFSSWDPWGLEKLSDLTKVIHRTWCCGDQQVCLWAAGIRPQRTEGTEAHQGEAGAALIYLDHTHQKNRNPLQSRDLQDNSYCSVLFSLPIIKLTWGRKFFSQI